MTHFTESKEEYVGSQWYSLFLGHFGSNLPFGHILPTNKLSHTENCPNILRKPERKILG